MSPRNQKPDDQDRGDLQAPADGRAAGAQPDLKVVDRRWWAREPDAGGDTSQAGSLKPSYVEELERRLADRDRELQETVARYRSAAQEFDEARARVRREMAKDMERSRRAMLAELLEIVDNLDRALEAAAESRNVDSLLEGVTIVRRQFLATLESFGVSRVESLGQPFDPALHDAVSIVESASAGSAETVVGVIKPGYRIGDEILRPAMVAVARPGSSES